MTPLTVMAIRKQIQNLFDSCTITIYRLEIGKRTMRNISLRNDCNKRNRTWCFQSYQHTIRLKCEDYEGFGSSQYLVFYSIKKKFHTMNTQLVSRERFFPRINFTSAPSTSSNTRLEDENGLDVEGKVKTRLLSMWNNVKYGKQHHTLIIRYIHDRKNTLQV